MSLSLACSLAAPMVVALGPGKFYGSSLPRPRFYTDVKLNDDRVDPPVPVMDPLLSWANEAHWSMGGLNFKRHRLQGRIEGSIKKLRAQQEKIQRRTPVSSVNPKPRVSGQKPLDLAPLDSASPESDEEAAVEREKKSEVRIASPPNGVVDRKRRRVRRLGEEFDRIAAEQVKRAREEAGGVAKRTRSRRTVAEEVEIDEEGAVVATLNKKGSIERKEADGGLPRRTSPRKKQSS